MKTFTASSFALAALFAVATDTGCFTATIHLDDGASARSPVVDGAYHINLFDLVEVSSPIDMHAACGGRQPVSIDEGLGFVGGLVNFVMNNIAPVISIMNTSVNCGVEQRPAG